ncbi:hypothetical protein [Pseudoalteromonas luteoviolacea]|uniref:Uncharacterized protein n=1 Tax=Pseudoalteromonas luteoviolacea DSM 6061 TaxID=1365250 RepID=A0A166YN05_9GAMM|nr:hypothetical protein [Pseudoalteromonas luteoviolacea]KZN43038.1 hypothetical protein N475_00225 [Pseudoalteromonas luteoviolacea DSM 6061]MBE0385545.1 hypothetical protein [Pseudoalteromonas luteoviolacea DSM 6061]
MVNKKIYLTPVAASLALTLGLSGCSLFDSEDGASIVPVDPVTPVDPSDVEGTATAEFNVFVSGKAVKGTMRNAELTVKELKNGELVDVAFRAELGSVEEKATSTSENAAIEKANAQIIAGSPSSLQTGDDGTYGFYIDQSFSGSLYITVKTTKTSGFIKCDAILGCGSFTEASSLDVNSNLKVDFDEWYQDDLTLNVVKQITAQANRKAKGAEGTTKAYTANATIFTSLASALLQSESQNGNEITSAAISQASLSTLLLLLGPDAAKEAVLLAGDISNGGAVDFTNVDSEDVIDAGTLALINVASTLQNIASNGGSNSTLDTVIGTLKEGVTGGAVKGSNNQAVASLANTLQEEVNKTATVFVAIASGDIDAIKEALKEVAPELSDDVVSDLADKAKEARDNAIDSGATDESTLGDAAEDSKKAVEDLGCTGDACDTDDQSFVNEGVTQLNEALNSAQSRFTTLNGQFDALNTALASVVTAGQTLDTDAQKAAYLQLADGLVVTIASNKLASDITNLTAEVTLILSSAESFVSLTNAAQTIVTTSQTLLQSSETLGTNYTALIASANAELQKATDAIGDGSNADKVLAETALARIAATQTTFNAQNTALDNTVEDANSQLAGATDTSSLQIALATAQSAIELFSEINSTIGAITDDLALAKTRAESYVASASDAQKEEAEQILAEVIAIETQLNSDITAFRAKEQAIRALRTQIESNFDIARGKEGTTRLTSINFVTKEGADSVFNAGEVVYDVVRDIWDQDLGSGQHSGTAPNYPEWTYTYDTDGYQIELKNTQEGTEMSAVAQVNSGASSRIILTWSGVLKTTDGQTAEVKSPDLAECERWALGTIASPNASCSVISIDGNISTIEDAKDFEASKAETFNIVEFIDGPFGFSGTMHAVMTSEDLNGNPTSLFVDDAVEIAQVNISGTTEGLAMSIDLDLRNENGNDQLGMAKVMLDLFNGYAFNVNLVDTDAPLVGEVSINNNTTPLKVGDVLEIENGFRVTYLDGVSIDYTNIDFLGQSGN